MLRVKGILWAALSSSTFGLAPLFTLLLLGVGYSSFEVLTYRWGVASLCLGAYGLLAGCDFRLGRRELGTVFLLSLFRAATSLSHAGRAAGTRHRRPVPFGGLLYDTGPARDG